MSSFYNAYETKPILIQTHHGSKADNFH